MQSREQDILQRSRNEHEPTKYKIGSTRKRREPQSLCLSIRKTNIKPTEAIHHREAKKTILSHRSC